MSNLGNRKMAVFFTSLLPQFAQGTDPPVPALLLPGVVFALDAITGTALIVLEVRVVADAR